MATVGSAAITADDWLATLKAFSGADALRRLIEERLVVQEAHRLRIAFKDAEVDAHIDRMKATQYPNDEAFAEMLHERGLSLAALRREVKTQLLLDRIVDEVGEISDEAVKAYYDSHLSEFTKPTRVELYGITAPDIRAAAGAFERLKEEDFAVVAQAVSIDEHAAEGGYWGWLSHEQIEPETVRTAAFASEVGKVHEPIEADGKGYVIWVKGKEPGSQVSLTEAASGIRGKLRAAKGVSKEAVLRGIIRRATISIQQSEYAYLTDEYARAKALQVIVDGTPLQLRTPPFVVPGSNRAVVPADPLLAALGAEAKWFGPPQWSDNVLQVKKGDVELVVQVDNPSARVTRGAEQGEATLDQAPLLRDGVLFVSPKWVVEQLGGSILFVPDEYALKIKSVREPAPPTP
ncbi:MAG: hypothetical protein FJX74_24585 [Armatimonadetes bacterium]|nr:hypothetical protein [Armatimonadota bacterium]